MAPCAEPTLANAARHAKSFTGLSWHTDNDLLPRRVEGQSLAPEMAHNQMSVLFGRHGAVGFHRLGLLTAFQPVTDWFGREIRLAVATRYSVTASGELSCRPQQRPSRKRYPVIGGAYLEMPRAETMSVQDLDVYIERNCEPFLNTVLPALPMPAARAKAATQFRRRVAQQLEAKMPKTASEIATLATSAGWRSAGVLALCNGLGQPELRKAFPSLPWKTLYEVFAHAARHDNASLVIAWVAGGGRHGRKRRPEVQYRGTVACRRRRIADKAGKTRLAKKPVCAL